MEATHESLSDRIVEETASSSQLEEFGIQGRLQHRATLTQPTPASVGTMGS